MHFRHRKRITMLRPIHIQVFSLILQFCFINTCKGFYTIYAPGLLRSNRKYTICVTLHNATIPSLLNVGIRSESSWSNMQLVSLEPFQTKMLDFFPTKLIDKRTYELVATSINGRPFDESVILHVSADDGPKIYIETDRGEYKPGDLVRFRVVVLDDNARPMKIIEPIKVVIMDRRKNRVKQFKDIPLTKGVYAGEFQLSKEPDLGLWSINVFMSGKYDREKSATFFVRRHVLPKFAAYIEADTDFVIANRFIKINVYGKYTYKRYVEGKVHLEMQQFGQTIYNQTAEIQDFMAKFEIDYENVNKSRPFREGFDGITVLAMVEEKQTGTKEASELFILLHNESYELTVLDEEIEFRNDVPYRIKIQIQHWNGTQVNDQLTPVFMEHNDKIYESKMDTNGLATFEFDYDEDSEYIFRYKDSSVTQESFLLDTFLREDIEKTECNLSLKKHIEPKLNSNIEINIDFNEQVSYFIYTLTAHGNIIDNEMIRFATDQNSTHIEVMATIEMIPVSFLYVHYIVGGYLKFCELKIELPRELENKISISVPTTVEPGTNITMKIETQIDSHISITATDMSTKLLAVGNVINENTILTDMLNDRSFSSLRRTQYPGLLSGLVTLFDASYLNDELPDTTLDMAKLNNKVVRSRIPVQNGLTSPFYSIANAIEKNEVISTSDLNNHVRETFPETWLFEDFEANNTITTITLKVPDTITTWVITAFTVNEQTGFGALWSQVELTVFQHFFINTYLPYSIKRGESVAIPAVVFNYYPIALQTEVVMENFFKEFKFIESRSNKVLDSLLEKQQILVPPNSGKEVIFRIRPLKAGLIDIKLGAQNDFYTDAILQKLKVEFDGLAEYQNNDLYVSLKEAENFTTYYMTTIPTNVVPGSEVLQLSVSGNMLLPTLENLHDLVDKPKGCGEQNMINFAPNILVLDYLRATRQTAKYTTLVGKARRYIEIGFQQQLKFLHEDGGYSVFGPNSSVPSNWLTAYVVRFFIKALRYLSIESRLIESSLNYLSTQQLTNGEFMQAGYLFHPSYQNRYGFTAYVLLSFQESKLYAKTYKDLIEKGLEFLSDNIDNIDDIYSLAIIANVFQAANHRKASLVLDKLRPLAKTQNGLKWWSANSGDRISDIEITSYILMALLKAPGEYVPIAKWLLEQRNSHGGFQSTQDTVVGLQALIKFAQTSAPKNDTLIKVEFKAYDNQQEIIKYGFLGLTPDNLMILQQEELPQATRSLDLQITGNGNIFLQFSYQYHIGETAIEPANTKHLHNSRNSRNFLEKSFEIQTKVELLFDALVMQMEVCITYTPLDDIKDLNTNMIVADIEFPSGYIQDINNIDELTHSDVVNRINTETPNKIILYFAYFTPLLPKCIEITANKKDEIQNLQPSVITVYDYYHSSRRETVTYKIKN